MRRLFAFAACLAGLTCGRTELVRLEVLPVVDAGRDAGRDAGADAGVDAGRDAGIDAGFDAGFDAGVDAGKPCLEGRFTLAPATPVVMLVIDRSGSMEQPFSSGGDTKWEGLLSSLRGALPPVNQTMELGLLVYPVSDSQACSSFATANLAPARGQVMQIMRELDTSPPGGGTPTAEALMTASSELRGRRTASSARAIVLATDGVPNCNGALDPRVNCRCDRPRCTSLECIDADRTVDVLKTSADAGVPTYVIGLETFGTALVTDLDRMAVAGGRPLPEGGKRYYAATSADELTRAFVSIRDQVSQCTFLTSSVPNATGSIRVEANGAVVPFDPGGQSGWNWTDRLNGELIFRGGACRQVMSGAMTLEALVACGSP